MSYKKALFTVGLATIFFAMSFGSLAYAGGGVNPPTCGSVGDPTIWGVVVVDCDKKVATARVKRIVDCQVETFSFTDGDYDGNCPATEIDAEDDSNVFLVVPFQPPPKNADGQPAKGVKINKARNLQIDGSSVSFDAQFKHCYP